MRLAIAIAFVAGCGSHGGSNDGMCTTDRDCGGAVCARDGSCLAESQVRMLVVKWTINGAQASQTTCARAPSFELVFSSDSSFFGYAPVPCMQGQFTIDKLPRYYTTVELDIDGGGGPLGASAISSAPDVSFDVQL
jgi:hypothetical protein